MIILLFEGYLSIAKKKKSKKIEITVLKIYPFFLNSNTVNKKL